MSATPAPTPSIPVFSPTLARICFWLSFAIGVGAAICVLQRSTGTPLDDEIGHFLLSRDFWSHPLLALSLWGRTLNTLIYAVPALLGLEGARWFSLALTGTATLITWRLAQALGLRNVFLVPLLFWFQPWVLENSWACLTEVPFLLFMVAGMYALVRERPALAGALLGCLPLIRHEGLGIVAAGLAYAVLARNGRLFGALMAPYAMYLLVYRVADGQWPLSLFTNAKPTDVYGSGGWLHFAAPIALSSGAVLAAALYGLPRLCRTNRGVLVAAVYFLYLMIHVVIYRFGLFASGGYVEFLVPLAPLLVVAAVAGVDALTDELAGWNLSLPWGAAVPACLAQVAVVVALAVATVGYAIRQSHPHLLKPVQAASIEAADWVRTHNLTDRRIEATDVWFFYALPLAFPDPIDLVLHTTPVAELPAGTLVVWDRKYSDGWRRPLAAMADHPEQWRRLQKFGPQDEVQLFERL